MIVICKNTPNFLRVTAVESDCEVRLPPPFNLCSLHAIESGQLLELAALRTTSWSLYFQLVSDT